MKKLLSLFLPLLIIFSLVGCLAGDDKVTYIRKDFKKIEHLEYYDDDPAHTSYKIKIDGKWWEADENGNLTGRGKRNLKTWEQSPNNPANSGGGC